MNKASLELRSAVAKLELRTAQLLQLSIEKLDASSETYAAVLVDQTLQIHLEDHSNNPPILQ